MSIELLVFYIVKDILCQEDFACHCPESPHQPSLLPSGEKAGMRGLADFHAHGRATGACGIVFNGTPSSNKAHRWTFCARRPPAECVTLASWIRRAPPVRLQFAAQGRPIKQRCET